MRRVWILVLVIGLFTACGAGEASAKRSAKTPGTFCSKAKAKGKGRGKPKQGAGHHTVAHSAAAHRTVSPNCAPKALAHQLLAAKTTAQRITAIKSVAGASAIGVYGPDGQRVIGGAETGPNGLYLYTFEVTSLADQMARGTADDSSFDEEAAALNALQITLNGAPVTGPALEAAVAGGLQKLPATSAKPVDALGLVVKDLGTASGINWAAPPASSANVLDPLQRYLIIVDIARPLLASLGAHVSAASAFVHLRTAPVAHQAGGCDSNFSGGVSGLGIGARFALGVFKTGPGVLLQGLLDGIEGTAFAYSFSVTAVHPTGNPASFGTNGPGSATPLNFQVKTEMLDDLSSTVIGCGALVGYTVPGQGPLSGTTINWDKSKLPDYGTVTCDSTCTNTNGDGIATLHFQPYDELLPGQGTLVTSYDSIIANAYPSKSNGNILGAILEALGITKFAVFGYSISYHDPGGYKVQIPAIVTSGTDSLGGNAYQFTDHFISEESCDLAASGFLGLNGSPLQPQPFLGLSPTPSPTSSYDEDEVVTPPGQDTYTSTGAATGAPASMQMGGLGYPAASIQNSFGFEDNDSGGSIGPMQLTGTWLFDGSGFHAQIVATRQGVTPGMQTFDLPVTRATDCG